VTFVTEPFENPISVCGNVVWEIGHIQNSPMLKPPRPSAQKAVASPTFKDNELDF
jgi:hypothetical protein